jgi:uncharacterized protein YbgA (DUF1722 family)/uncharacterized protein YbbK (DUF523 family)
METPEKVIQVGISSCLLGNPVRYDGGHKRHSYIESTLGRYFHFLPFCPETDIGLGIPREPIRLQQQDGEVSCVGVKDPSLDFTGRLQDCAERQRAWHADICGYILKKDSPSCGMERVKLYRNDMPERSGRGIYAARMMDNYPWLPVEEEGRLGDPLLRENFIQRVYVLHRWKVMLQQGLSPAALTGFHARHKLIIMSHDQNDYRELGRLAASADRDKLDEVADRYLELLMIALKKIATRGNQVNVLQHIQGYLKKHLDADDKDELGETIERYRRGELPLIVPVTLLKHHFRKSPDPFIADSWYMEPHPRELSLLNTV